MKAVVLLSGGLDSATTLAIALSRSFSVTALSVDYGQRHRVELECATKLTQSMGVKDHRVVTLDLRAIGNSALTASIDVPKNRTSDEMQTGIPVTYVPARNTILLGVALGLAESIGAFDIFFGANAADFTGYPDCRPAFFTAFEQLANLATKAGVEGKGRFQIHTPLITMTKPEIIREGVKRGVDYSLTLSCYDPDEQGRACGVCDACLLRRNGFATAGVPDPTTYRD